MNLLQKWKKRNFLKSTIADKKERLIALNAINKKSAYDKFLIGEYTRIIQQYEKELKEL